MILTNLIKDENGQTIDALMLKQKDFSSGSKGYFGQGKLELEGKRYQAQVQLVEIGSKTEQGVTTRE